MQLQSLFHQKGSSAAQDEGSLINRTNFKLSPIPTTHSQATADAAIFYDMIAATRVFRNPDYSKLAKPSYSTLILFLASTGLRISEAVGVQKSDFEENVLKLRKRFYQSDNGGDFGDLKTKKSVRDLPLPAWLADRVKSLAEGDGFCFRSQAGTPINQKNALRRYIHPACKELGFRIGGWHDFRHTLTTWALKKYPTKVVSEMVGHASVKTTLDVYSHVLQEDFSEPLAEVAGKLLHDVA